MSALVLRFSGRCRAVPGVQPAVHACGRSTRLEPQALRGIVPPQRQRVLAALALSGIITAFLRVNM